MYVYRVSVEELLKHVVEDEEKRREILERMKRARRVRVRPGERIFLANGVVVEKTHDNRLIIYELNDDTSIGS